jgi:hypothetical protein
LTSSPLLLIFRFGYPARVIAFPCLCVILS